MLGAAGGPGKSFGWDVFALCVVQFEASVVRSSFFGSM